MMPLSRHLRVLLLCLLALCLPACAHYEVNEKSDTFLPNEGYRFDKLGHAADADALFICLTFSGGGTRAAALAYGVLEELQRTKIGAGTEKTLLEEVDCISSVSGGSFTSSYYGLFRDRLFEDFRARFLERDIEGALLGRLLNPLNWIRLMSPNFGRIDLAAELYHEEIFEEKAFSDLMSQGRPFIILNATNLESGRRFDFTHLYFDAMGSTLEEYPIARGVAASSAFPLLLSPISLVNHPTAPAYEPPGWYAGGLESRHESRRRYQAAKDLAYYLDKQHQYIHLMDGGLSDNIGSRAVLDAYTHGFMRPRINNGQIQRLVVILVNARTQPHEELARRESPPGLKDVAYKTATISLDNYSFESVALMIDDLNQRMQDQLNLEGCQAYLTEHCPDAPPIDTFENVIDPYIIEVNFENASDIEGEDPDYYLSLPTSFRLDPEQVEKLVNIGPKLLRASPQYQCLVAVLDAEARGLPRPEQCPVGAGISGVEEEDS